MTNLCQSNRTGTHFHAAVPILHVGSHKMSLGYHVQALGFRLDWNAAGMASVSRGSCSVMLCDGVQGKPGTSVWIGVGDAEALFQEFSAKGATIRLPPANYPWALDFHVEDPDGHVLRFGSVAKANQPYSEWIAWYEEKFPPLADSPK